MPLAGLIILTLTFIISGPGLNYSGPITSASISCLSVLPVSNAAGTETQIDTVSVLAFTGTTAPSGILYAAVALPEPVVKIYRSADAGATWQPLLDITVPAAVRQLEMLAPKADPSHLYIFILDTAAWGDLYLLRLKPEADSWNLLPVAVGPDTIDRFTAAVDHSRHYYLYCLYVNQQRTGANGRFTRSLNYGFSWEPAQEFYNCLEPCLYFGSGSVLHCSWRFGLNGREIHYARNRHFGAAGRWDELKVIASGGEKCFNPQVVQADTSPPYRAPVWIAWTVAHRDTEMLDIAITYSTDGGTSFAQPVTMGEPFVDEWWPALAASANSAYLVYNAGGAGSNDPTVLYLRSARAYAPELWSGLLKINEPRVNALVSGARPRILPAGALFSHYGYPFARGIFFRASTPRPDRPPALQLTTPSQPDQIIVDITGRKIPRSRMNSSPGVYFVLSGNQIHKFKLLVIK
jgi:hypothetical protein